MQCLGLSCHTFIGNLPQHIGHGHCPVLHLGLGCTADIPTQTDNLVIIRHLAAHGYNARILLRSLQANVEKEHIPAGLYLLAGIVYPAGGGVFCTLRRSFFNVYRLPKFQDMRTPAM